MATKYRSIRHCPPPPSLYPWLVFPHGKNTRNQTFYSPSEPNNNGYLKSIPELENKSILLSCHGWLVLNLCNKESQFLLWNPVTLESIHLPPLHLRSKQYVQEVVLTSSPKVAGSTLLLFVRNPNMIIFCCIEKHTWITRGYYDDIKVIGEDKSDFFDFPVVCNDRIFATTFCRCRMVEIEIIKQRRLVIRPLKSCGLPFLPSVWHKVENYLVESCGDLFMINVQKHYSEVMNIVVLKFDFSVMEWNKVESCPDRAFFLSNGRAISCWSPTGSGSTTNVIANRVHFTLYQDKSLYSYHIEDKTVSVSLPCPNLPAPWSTPIWVLPDGGVAKAQTEHQEEKQSQEARVLGHSQISKEEEKREEANNTTTTLILDELCDDIGKRIAENLIIPSDYMNFRAVCRWSRSVAPVKEWRTLSPSEELEKHILSPWLILPNTSKGLLVNSLVDPALGDNHKYYLTIPQELEDAIVCFSKDGWMFMSKELSLKLYNPFTKTIICLPDLDPIGQTYFFSSLPNSSDCVVVAISFFIGAVSLIRPGMDKWIHTELLKEEVDVNFDRTHTYPVFLNDSFYFLGGKNDCLGVLKIEEGETNAVLSVYKLDRPCSRSCDKIYLVECDGEILAVFVGKTERWVQVFKINLSKMVWEEVESLGKYSLYLCNLSTLAVPAKTPAMENKIYFPRFYGDSMVYYSLETRMFHYSSSDSSKDTTLIDSYGCKMQFRCCWIQPRRKMGRFGVGRNWLVEEKDGMRGGRVASMGLAVGEWRGKVRRGKWKEEEDRERVVIWLEEEAEEALDLVRRGGGRDGKGDLVAGEV
ncbi:hypothetical protein ACH5RR_037982 [Cinchona calisaya]|uniref:KIB1-4 beta-propeller domain-containing protein n=1 Tax=Cinchona calisaya TaxID=153742 RepID=A0ABD2Y7Q8_9GENT